MSLMNKEIRRELKALTREQKHLERMQRKLESAADRESEKIRAGMIRARKVNQKIFLRLNKRIMILQGRLS